jgi:RNA polymerase sigma-70 factor (ECF subfamily)
VLLDDETPGPEARYDARESIALSFVAGLQHLPPQQRAVLVLRDALGFTAAETAGILETTTAAVNGALIRARARLHQDRDPGDAPQPKSPAETAVVGRFADALQRSDLDRLAAVLTHDARFTTPPEPVEFRGPQAITRFFTELPFWGQELKLVPTRANNQPALVYYLPDPRAPIWRAGSILVLALRGNQVCAVTRFGHQRLLAHFGLPRTLPKD